MTARSAPTTHGPRSRLPTRPLRCDRPKSYCSGWCCFRGQGQSSDLASGLLLLALEGTHVGFHAAAQRSTRPEGTLDTVAVNSATLPGMSSLSREEISSLVAATEHWHHVIRFPHGIASPGAYDPTDLLERLALPNDMTGMRVLDVGTRDGFFAFACEQRGAEVIAIDHAAPQLTGFPTAKRILGAKTDYQQANVYDLTAKSFGFFDTILCLGVVYHLRHPLLCLDRLRDLAKSGATLLVESLVCDDRFFVAREEAKSLRELAPALTGFPIAQFLPAYRFHSDGSNKWSPNAACLQAMIEEARFDVERCDTWGDRALVQAVAVDDPERTRLNEMDRGLRNVF